MGSATRRYVYVLQSVSTPSRHYVGLTDDVEARLAKHNAGLSIHTDKYRPWRRHVVIEFSNHDVATRFAWRSVRPNGAVIRALSTVRPSALDACGEDRI